MQSVFLIQQYNIEISDWMQPVLISQMKRKRGNIQGSVALIPELCSLTGTVSKHQTIMPTDMGILTAAFCQVQENCFVCINVSLGTHFVAKRLAI